MEPDELLDEKYVYAIVGASRDESKYGHKVLADLKGAGYRVVPVNPHADEVLGLKAYPSLEDLPERPDVVVCVVPPRVTEQVVEEAASLGVRKVWMQPGSSSEKAIRSCEEHGIGCVHDACVMIERKS
ncbi:MAG: CoA-binding protein [Candidatus Woesearchaeota archaeon]